MNQKFVALLEKEICAAHHMIVMNACCVEPVTSCIPSKICLHSSLPRISENSY